MMRCEHCELLSINGIVCHEHGCPNARARYDADSEEWIKQVEWHNRGFLKLTEAGCAAVADYEACASCGEATHAHEAACIHCGVTKRRR